MASILEKDPHVFLERTWDDKTKLPEKQKFSGDNGKKAEIHFDSGLLGIEFFYEKTLPDFIHAGNELQWNWCETFSKFDTISNQLEAGPIIIKHMKSISVLSLPWNMYGPIKSIHTASQGVIVAS